MNRQFDYLGSQRKASVSVLKLQEKPNPAFKAPTYNIRDSRFLSSRQGGSYYPADIAGLFLYFLVLTVHSVRKFLSNGMKILRKRIIINMISLLYNPVNNNLSHCTFLKVPPIRWDLNGVYHKNSKNLLKLVLSSE